MTKKVAVIGCGNWGRNLIRNFYSLGALHSICSSNAEKRQSLCNKYPEVKGVTNLTEVLRNPEIEGIVLATPAHTHATLAREMLWAGKDVFVEKPLCLSSQEGKDLVNLAREKDLILMVGHILWYHPAVLKLKELIDSGQLGNIQYLYSNRLNIGQIKKENVLWSFAPHDISLILGLTGEKPESVRVQGGNFLDQEIADTTVTLLNFASGIRSHIFVSWLHPFKEQKLVVVGDQQMAVFDDTADWEEKLKIYPHSIDINGGIPVANKAPVELIEVEKKEPLLEECKHFLECISHRHTPRTDGEEALRTLEVLDACQKSLEQEKKIGISTFQLKNYPNC